MTNQEHSSLRACRRDACASGKSRRGAAKIGLDGATSSNRWLAPIGFATLLVLARCHEHAAGSAKLDSERVISADAGPDAKAYLPGSFT